MFIVFEGPDNVGKTTIIEKVKDKLNKLLPEIEVVTTREPGGTEFAENIRNLVLQNDTEVVEGSNPMVNFHLFTAARQHHWDNLIFPSLEAGKIVLCDRFVMSTIVYQGIMGGMCYDGIRELFSNQPWINFPTLTFLMSRAGQKFESGDEATLYDQMNSFYAAAAVTLQSMSPDQLVEKWFVADKHLEENDQDAAVEGIIKTILSTAGLPEDFDPSMVAAESQSTH